jgi:4-carboxymuconolactone decarboxylase
MRLEKLDLNMLTIGQQQVMEDILQGPRRAQMQDIGLVGPFDVFVRAPSLGGPAQALGAAVRYGSSLPDNVREVAICTVGHFHQARFEFAAHHALAIAAGVNATTLEQLRCDQVPDFVGSEGLAYRLTRALLGIVGHTQNSS